MSAGSWPRTTTRKDCVARSGGCQVMVPGRRRSAYTRALTPGTPGACRTGVMPEVAHHFSKWVIIARAVASSAAVTSRTTRACPADHVKGSGRGRCARRGTGRSDERRVGPAEATFTQGGSAGRALEEAPQGDRRDPLPGADRSALAGSACTFRQVEDRLRTTQMLVGERYVGQDPACRPSRRRRGRPHRLSMASVYSTSCRAHQHAAGARKKPPRVPGEDTRPDSTAPTRDSDAPGAD